MPWPRRCRDVTALFVACVFLHRYFARRSMAPHRNNLLVSCARGLLECQGRRVPAAGSACARAEVCGHAERGCDTGPPAPPQVVAMACLYLGGKVQDSPKSVRDIMYACLERRYQGQPEVRRPLSAGPSGALCRGVPRKGGEAGMAWGGLARQRCCCTSPPQLLRAFRNNEWYQRARERVFLAGASLRGSAAAAATPGCPPALLPRSPAAAITSSDLCRPARV